MMAKTKTKKADLQLWCNSKKCTNGKLDSRFNSGANAGSGILEGTLQDHEYVNSSLDKVNGWKVNGIRSQGGCRDSAADYRTTRCMNCGAISTGDFATD
jgi:hypothetical protein